MGGGAVFFYLPCFLKPNMPYLPDRAGEKNLFRELSGLIISSVRMEKNFSIPEGYLHYVSYKKCVR